MYTYPEYDPNNPDSHEAPSLGMLQRVGWQCGTSQLIPDSTATIRFHMVCRTQSTNPVPLPEVEGPIIVGNQTTVRILTDPNAIIGDALHRW